MSQSISVDAFFDLLWGQAPQGWVTLVTYPGGRFRQDRSPTDEVWFNWPLERDDLLATVHSARDKDLYFCPVLFKDKPYTVVEDGKDVRKGGRRKDNTAWVGCVYADADGAQPDVFKIEPTLTVQTSPGRHHLYWVLKEPDGDVDKATRSGQVVAYAHADQGCDLGGWDTTQLLRVPGTTNNKPTNPGGHHVEAATSGLLYTYRQIEEHYSVKDVPVPAAYGTSLEPMPEQFPTHATAMAWIADDPRAVEFTQAKGRAPTRERKGNRSELMWAFLRHLAESGVPRPIAFTLGWHVQYNKYRIKGHPPQSFWNELCKAYSKLGVEVDDNAEAPEPVRVINAEPARSTPRALELLSRGERERVPHTILDQYVDWARTRTDAVPQYQRAAFMTVLGSVFGEFGKPCTKFDSGYLNMWWMVLGGTTMSRKSTVRNMMIRMLRHLSDQEYYYDLGSDATSEGLHGALLDRGGLSSLFHRDEVQGLLDEQKAKNYLAGLQEKQTELYDGHVPGKLRAGTGFTPGVETVFHMYLTGVTDHVTKKLTLDEFQSGHLARFMYMYAPQPEITLENSSIEMDDEDDSSMPGVDRNYELIVDKIRRGRRFWQQEKGIRRGQQRKIFWEKDAWKRLNEARHAAFLWASKHQHKSVLEPTIQRTMMTTLKIATLLAMAECSEKVQMGHLLRALDLTEESVSHLVTLTEMIASTETGRTQDEVLSTVLNAGPKGIAYAKLYNTYRKRLKQEHLRQVVLDLRAAGMVTTDGKYISARMDQ